MIPLQRIGVTVPARNEASGITACLRSLDAAAARSPRPVVVAVACDTCNDGTNTIARHYEPRSIQLVIVEGRWQSAGAARAAATDACRSLLVGDPATTWLATTDADTTVPPDWLARQVTAADRGADVILGIVELDAGTPTPLRDAFLDVYERGVEHPHAHGANFGIRGSTYAAAGGWNHAVTVGEEHDLLARAIDIGATVLRTNELVVSTSGRTSSRVIGGFATDLGELAGGERVA